MTPNDKWYLSRALFLQDAPATTARDLCVNDARSPNEPERTPRVDDAFVIPDIFRRPPCLRSYIFTGFNGVMKKKTGRIL